MDDEVDPSRSLIKVRNVDATLYGAPWGVCCLFRVDQNYMVK